MPQPQQTPSRTSHISPPPHNNSFEFESHHLQIICLPQIHTQIMTLSKCTTIAGGLFRKWNSNNCLHTELTTEINDVKCVSMQKHYHHLLLPKTHPLLHTNANTHICEYTRASWNTTWPRRANASARARERELNTFIWMMACVGRMNIVLIM